MQEEAIYLYYSGRRFSASGLSPEAVVERLRQRNINLPGGRVELPDQNLVVQPSGEFRSEQEIGQVVMDVQNGYPVYLRDLADIVRGYEDPPNVMNFRTLQGRSAAAAHRAAARRSAARMRSAVGRSPRHAGPPGLLQPADDACHHAFHPAGEGGPDQRIWSRHRSGPRFAPRRAARRPADRTDEQ